MLAVRILLFLMIWSAFAQQEPGTCDKISCHTQCNQCKQYTRKGLSFGYCDMDTCYCTNIDFYAYNASAETS
ncbi:unnamed protein product [Bursaphelenchus xylophilus]|uniref:(pine wood nematode) hypothetical protein n=1 Tax=Bursaphelenchus xylophilus TaxID=6326 RepID=A0A1I7SDY5_BURXY|nr:unnamed protein product [Bursaphelenchus xylophilus]CAG9100373.1 unnamed protein product [Bursaphelenchus xylophilus]